MTTTIPPVPPYPKPIQVFSGGDVDAYSQAWLNRDAAQTANIAALTQQLADLTPAPTGPIFGSNLEISYADTVSKFGSVPMAKLFDGGSGIWPNVASVMGAGRKRGQSCAKPNMVDLAAGKLNGQVEAFITGQLNAGVERLLVTPWQEPNGELKSGTLSLSTWRNAVIQVGKCVQNVGVKGKVFVAQTYTAQQTREGSTCLDSWIVTPDLLGGIDWSIICWDNYLNPSGAANYGGDPYATPYPKPSSIADEMYAQTGRTGYLDSWAISEWGCPWRKNIAGGDPNQDLRLAAMKAYMDYILALPTLPKHVMLWTGHGTKFDQTIGPKIADFWKGYVAQSA